MNMQKVVERLTYFTTFYIYTSELKEAITYLENEMKRETDKVGKIKEYCKDMIELWKDNGEKQRSYASVLSAIDSLEDK